MAIALCLQVVSQTFGAAHEKIVVDLHSHRAEIRALLLRHTPPGSTVADVQKFVSTELSRSGYAPPKIENGPATGPAAKGSPRRGVKTIRVYLGQYYDHPEVVFLTTPLFMQKEVSAQWAFDAHDRLVEIFVDKATGVY